MRPTTEFPKEFADRYRAEGYWQGELLGDILDSWLKRTPDRIALVDPTCRWTYGELNHEVERIACGLLQLGIRADQCVVVQMPNVCAFAAVLLALFRIGAIPVLALPNHRRSEVVYLASTSNAAAYIARGKHLGFDFGGLARSLREEVPTVRHVIIDGECAPDFISLSALRGEARGSPRLDPSGVALMLLSGGTTGRPKLIPRTHDDYAFQIRATAAGLGFGASDAYLAALPVAHNAALGCPGLLGALRAGGKVVFPESPAPEVVFTQFSAEAITLTTAMPPLLQLWTTAARTSALPRSKLIMQVGSARLPPLVARDAIALLGCRLTQWFGMAEGLLTFTRLDDPEEVAIRTQGRPLAAADELRVVGDNDVEVAPGEVGELLTRGPYTLRGYFNSPDHNKERFTSDGFLRTGDLVRIDALGNMSVEGRVKDVINRGGEKVVAGELEDLILGCDGVKAVAVIGVPDDSGLERVCAVLITNGRTPSLQQLRVFLRESGVADYKLPTQTEYVDQFPLTNVGKVDKSRMRRQLMHSPRVLDQASPPHEP